MWPYFVVVAQPPIGYLPHLRKVAEEVKAQVDHVTAKSIELLSI